MLWLFSAVRLLSYVCQVTLSTVYNKCRCCFVSFNLCVCCSVKFLSLSLAVHSRSGEKLSEQWHSLVEPVPGLPMLYRERRDFFQPPVSLSYDKNEELAHCQIWVRNLDHVVACVLSRSQDICILKPQSRWHVAMTVVDNILAFIPKTPLLHWVNTSQLTFVGYRALRVSQWQTARLSPWLGYHV